MTKTVAKGPALNSSQNELRRLLLWARDNPEDWDIICDPASAPSDFLYIAGLIERLYQAKLYTTMFLVMYSNFFIAGIDRAIIKTTNECFLDVPTETLISRFYQNVKLKVEEITQTREGKE